MLLSPADPAAAKGITGSQLNTINSGLIPSSFFRGSNNEAPTTVPKAYINYIFLDEQFKYAGGGASRVGPTSGVVYDHWYNDASLQNIQVPKNGYIFVYVSNESNLDVFFDNLQVIHKPGPLVQEQAYYPFGLTMAGISSQAAGGLENKIKFQKQELQHKEFSDGSGLETYQFKYRMDDPQIGRFWSIDPLVSKYVYNSTYAFSENKVTGHVELEGLESQSINDLKDKSLKALAQPSVQNSLNKANSNLSNAASIKLTVGPGAGLDVKTKGGELHASLNGPEASVTFKTNGKVELKASAASADAGGSAGSAHVGASAEAGSVEYKDGKLDAKVIETSQNASLSKEGNGGKAEASSDGDVSIGAKLGVVGVEIKASLTKAGEGVVNFFEAIGNYVNEKFKQEVPTQLGGNNQLDPNEK